MVICVNKMQNLAQFHEVTAGYEYPASSFLLDNESVSDYIRGTNDSCSAFFINQAPPLAVAARTLAELARVMTSPPGTVHISQELEFRRKINIGENLALLARVEKRIDRGELHTLTTSFTILNSYREIVMTGEITVGCRSSEAGWQHS